MQTSRSDVDRRFKPEIFCKNSSSIGYSSMYLKLGDLFIYKERYTDGSFHYRLAKCHGQIKPLNKISESDELKWYVLAQSANWLMTFTYERWIDPEDIVETYDREHVNPNIAKFFEEREKMDFPVKSFTGVIK